MLADLQPDKKREQTAKADAADSVAKTKKVEADNADAIQKAKLNTEQERGKTERTKQAVNSATANLRGAQVVESGAKAANQRAGAAAHYAAARASDRSNVSEFSAYDSKGREHKFRTKDAADAYAKQHGTFKEEIRPKRQRQRQRCVAEQRVEPPQRLQVVVGITKATTERRVQV